MMENIMSKYTLRFKDKEVELRYQTQSVQKYIKPFYYALLILTLLSNIVQLILRVKSLETVSNYFILQVSIINTGFIALTLINICILYKREKLAQIAITIENMYFLLLQINFTVPTTGQEYFLYGSSFSSLQTGVYFITDFQYSCPSVILHMIFKFSITTYLSRKVDLMLLIMFFIINIFMIFVLYICNKAQRLQFLMTVKEDTITKQLETIINKPFAKIKYNDRKLQLEIQVGKSIHRLLGYSRELCFGCNVRSFLRYCKYNCDTLEKGIFTRNIPLNKSFVVLFQKCRVKIRVCQFNMDQSLILIQEDVMERPGEYAPIPAQLKRSLLLQFKSSSRTIANQQFKFGLMSLLRMNNLLIKTVNVTKLVNKLLKLNKLDGKVFILTLSPQSIKLTTFCYQFQIFMIQIFNIICEMEQLGDKLEGFVLTAFNIYLVMKIKLKHQKAFFSLYDSNFFIKQTSQLILQVPLTQNLELYFQKIIPFSNNVDYFN